MDPITILGLFASIIEIANFVEKTAGRSPTADAIERVFNERAADLKSPEGRLKQVISPAQLKAEIKTVLSLRVTDKDFLDRIDQKCLPPYREAVRDPDTSNADVDEAYEVAKRCVCENIRLARRHTSGQFPNEEFKRLWEEFGCGT